MANYNFGVGISETVLNHLSLRIYEACYPRFFSGKLQVNRLNVAQVSWNIVSPPVFDLRQTEPGQAAWREKISESLKGDESLASEMREYLTQDMVCLSLNIPALELQIQACGGDASPTLKAAVQIDCRADISPDNRLMFDVLSAHAAISNEPMMEWLINNLVLPELIAQLEKTLLKGVALPALNSGDVELSAPEMMADNDILTVFSALRQNGATVLPKTGFNWPADKCFLFADDALLAAAAAEGIKKLRESGSAQTKILNLTLSAGYTVSMANPQVRAASGGALTLAVDASGSGSAKASLDIGIAKIPITMGLGITASPEILASFSVDDKNRLVLTLDKILDFHVSIDLRHVPKIIDKFISQIISFLGKPLSQLIASMLRGKQFPVINIPLLPISEEGVSMNVALSKLVFQDITDPNGKKLFMASGDVDLIKKQ